MLGSEAHFNTLLLYNLDSIERIQRSKLKQSKFKERSQVEGIADLNHPFFRVNETQRNQKGGNNES